jgi:hypothetical protein
MGLSFRVLLIFALSLPAGLQAAPKIKGAVNYQFNASSTSVTLSCERIQNDSAENATGTVEVKLWALTSAYQGGGISGHVLASYKLEGLRPGMGYPAPKRTLKPVMPARKANYYIVLTVSEYRKGGYVITDWRQFSKTASLGPLKLFTLGGAWSWQTSYEGGTLDLKVDKISHNRTGKTGSLRLAVWATKSPYKGGDISGWQLGFVDKKALEPGYSYNDVENVARLKRPPAGTYHMSLVLSEYRDGSYVIVDYRPGAKTASFSGP